jgi:hypothetical protein
MENSKFELKVVEQIDHYNAKNWFVVMEVESGEELLDVDTKSEAENGMLNMIRKGQGKYFTKQDLVEGYAYMLKPFPGGSDKYGVCEVCGNHADSVYLLTEMVRYWSALQRKESLSIALHWCRPDMFGHKECLSGLTSKRFLSSGVEGIHGQRESS